MFVKTQREFSPHAMCRARVQRSQTSWAASYGCATWTSSIVNNTTRDAKQSVISNGERHSCASAGHKFMFRYKIVCNSLNSTSIFVESALFKL